VSTVAVKTRSKVDLGDPLVRTRMRMAMQAAGLRCTDMAREFGVTRRTISRWLNPSCSIELRIAVLSYWAYLTDTDMFWLDPDVMSTGEEDGE
jgi:transcriptional regulator with XRE-family HTH domain